MAKKFSGELPDYAEVALNVYELHYTGTVGYLIGKLFHVGIEVYWLEWSYGAGDDWTGVFPCQPKQSSLGTYLESVPLGRTPYTPQGVLDILRRLRPKWLGPEYQLLSHNCQIFCAELAQKLEVKPLPDWVFETLRRFGNVPDTINEIKPQARASIVALAGGVNSSIQDPEIPSSEWAAAVEEVWDQAQSFVLDRAAEAENASRFEDIFIELFHSADEGLVQVLSKDKSFQAMFHQAVGGVLGISTEKNDEVWLELRYMVPNASRLLVGLIIHASEDDDDDWPHPKPSLQDFVKSFIPSLKKSRYAQRADIGRFLDSHLRLITAPGMLRYGYRVESSAGPVEVRSGPPLPSSSYRYAAKAKATLGRLQQIRSKLRHPHALT